MPGASPFESDPPRVPKRPQFTLLSMLAVMGLFSVMAALLGGLLRNVVGHGAMGIAVVLAAVASPLVAVVVFGIAKNVARLQRCRKERKRRE